ncbi:hypothetical protein [Sphingobium aromaticivastans]|uniref:hypothetical protein n=1 Tax=Sphingobium aromaticivastans TaxID=1778665 RepID=UPI003015A3A3
MIAALLLLLQGSAATLPPPKDLDAEIAQVMKEWAGDYDSPPGMPERHAVVRPIAVPKLAKRAMFVEVRDGGAQGKIIFQRIIAFTDDPDRVRNWAASYYFPDAAAHARLDQRGAEAAAIGPDDISVFDPRPGACAINIFPEGGRYMLTARKEECRIVSKLRPGFVFHPEFRLSVGGERFGFYEQGFFENGEPAAPPLTYELMKVKK